MRAAVDAVVAANRFKRFLEDLSVSAGEPIAEEGDAETEDRAAIA